DTKQQHRTKTDSLPDAVVTCIGGGSNAKVLVYPFVYEEDVSLYGVEAGRGGFATGKHAATFTDGTIGILHGTMTHLLQDTHGQIQEAFSISAGLDYPGVGPEHSHLHATNRVTYDSITDQEALEAFQYLSKVEGIIPALEG